MTCLDPWSGGSRPSDKGGRHPDSEKRREAQPQKDFFGPSSLIWLKNKGAGAPGPPGPLPWIR